MSFKQKAIGRAIHRRYWQLGAQDCTAHIISGGGGKNCHFTGLINYFQPQSEFISMERQHVTFYLHCLIFCVCQRNTLNPGRVIPCHPCRFSEHTSKGIESPPLVLIFVFVGARVVRLYDPQEFGGVFHPQPLSFI